MFNRITLLYIVGFSFWGCEDEPNEILFSAVPEVFTKKVLIEEFTGAWCGYCPDGAYMVDNIINENNGHVIGVSTHSSDAMEVSQTSFLESIYQNTGYPSGMVDRVSYGGYVCMNRGYWEYITTNQLSKTAACGLAINSEISGKNAKVEVHVGFNTNLNGDYRLTIYLIEDGVIGVGNGYDQANFYDTDPNSPFYGLGNPIEGYEHNHTLREVLTESLGDPLDNSNLISGGEQIALYTVDITPYNTSNLSIVAFVHYVGATITEHEIMNVQECKIDGFQDWD